MMFKLYLDPGHGGKDPGAVGNGLQEKDLTLSISLKIRDILTSEYDDITIKMSRSGDTFPTLQQRTQEANSWGADYFLSIHINSGGGTGFETFVDRSAESGTVNYQDIIHDEILKLIDLKDRGKKKAGFHVIHESNMPALLTECGFIDTASDAAKMKDPDWVEAVARGHVNGLAKAFNLKTIKGVIVVVEPTLNANQEKVRQEAIGLGITDGNDPFRQVNQWYVWSAMIPLARRIEELEKKLKQL